MTAVPRAAALVGAGVLAACGVLPPAPDGAAWVNAVTIVAAGDIADCAQDVASASVAARTALLIQPTDAAVLTVGDNTYPVGAPSEFADCFDPTWGAFKERIYPTPGNHDYQTPGADGYFEYFGLRAGPDRRGWYSIDIAGWHIVSLNSNVDARAGSAQHAWLIADLAASQAACTIAVWHHPVYTSGPHGNDARMRDALAALHAAGAEIVLVGHDHVYERMVPHDADGAPDPLRGIRSFTVGTGGARLYRFKAPHPASAARDNTTHGVLRLTLGERRYRWEFVPVDGGPSRDRGEADCHQ
jgi:3',5'-cyclic AMP phosphodiesterase CpdA